ncbi:MAG: GGDEF domain-containing protein [Pseudomonadota bacterium]
MSLTPFSLSSMSPGQHAMLLIAIDDLAPLGRLFGEVIIDEVIRESYQRLAKVSPHIGNLWQPHAQRFAITVPGMAEDGARELATAAQATLASAPIETSHGEVAITASIGCAVASNASLTTLGAAANDALIDALNSGINSIRVARSDREVERQRAHVLSAAQTALMSLGAGHVSIVYQPVVSALGEQRVAFHQCLARHIQTDGQTFTAREFLPKVARLGLSEMLDRQVLVLALDTLRQNPLARLAVHVLPTASEDQEWMAILRNAMRGCEGIADRLIVEIRERDISHETGRYRKFLKTLRETGACIGLTQFGSECLTFSQLSDLRPDMVKLDRRLTDGIASNQDAQILLDSLVAKADRLEMMVVADGISSKQDAHILAGLGVGYLQGYQFGEESTVLHPQHEPLQRLRRTA